MLDTGRSSCFWLGVHAQHPRTITRLARCVNGLEPASTPLTRGKLACATRFAEPQGTYNFFDRGWSAYTVPILRRLPSGSHLRRSVRTMMDIEMTSPIGPMIATGCEETRRLEFPGYAAEVDLCNLLQSMTLSKRKTKKGSRGTNNNATLCPVCLARCKRARCKHGGLGLPLRRVGIVKLKVQFMRPTPYIRQLTNSNHHHPNFPTPGMPLPPVHSRFPRPRVPRALSVPLPVSRSVNLPDDGRRVCGHDSNPSEPSKCVPSRPQRMRRGSTGDRSGP